MNPSSIRAIGDESPHAFPGGEAGVAGGVEKMFLDYYGLAEQPFGVTPDPRFLYLGCKHREALTALDYGTKSNRGFVALIAKPGMGKTSLLFQFLESLRDNARTAFIFQTDGNSKDLLHHLLADIGIDSKGKDLSEMRSMLHGVLLEEMRAGRRFVLVIDEAQNLSEEALESVRLLSNFETPHAKLIQIVLAGQPQLAERLGRTSLAQLRQRISFFIKIEPFTREESDACIGYRLWVASYRGPQIFTPGALRMIAEKSEGVPRMINNICFGAMSLGWALKRKTIDLEMITDVLDELNPGLKNEIPDVVPQLKPETEPKIVTSQVFRTMDQDLPSRRWLPKLAVAGALLLVLAWFMIYLNAGKTRASETGFQTLSTAPVTLDTQKQGEPAAIASGPSSLQQMNDSGSDVSQPLAPPPPDSPKSVGDGLISSIRRYSTEVVAEIRWFFGSLARFTFGKAS